MITDKQIIYAIMVLYNPKLELTKEAIKHLSQQVDKIICVDNSTTDNQQFSLVSNNLLYIPLKQNLGIAKAQNIAISRFSSECDFFFFIDQDSIVQNEMVSNLLSQFIRIKKTLGYNIGGIGPRPYNREQGKIYLGSIKKGEFIDTGLSKVSELINSGSLIPSKAFEKCGLMDESLFIDGVDHEWCWRAHTKCNYSFFICEDTYLSHKLGEGDRRFLWKKVAIPTPFRTYYQFRNYIKLIRRNYVPIYWKASNGLKYLIKFFYFPTFVSPRLSYLKNMARGIRDGILNR